MLNVIDAFTHECLVVLTLVLLDLPQGKGNLLVRVAILLHGTTPSLGFTVPKNLRSHQTSFVGPVSGGQDHLREGAVDRAASGGAHPAHPAILLREHVDLA